MSNFFNKDFVFFKNRFTKKRTNKNSNCGRPRSLAQEFMWTAKRDTFATKQVGINVLGVKTVKMQ